MADFMTSIESLVRDCVVRIDRPAGTAHPRYPAAVYPVDYGYLVGTVAADGDGIDVFRGRATSAGVVAVAVTLDRGKRDVEAKIILDCDAGEIELVRSFLADTLGLDVHLVLR